MEGVKENIKMIHGVPEKLKDYDIEMKKKHKFHKGTKKEGKSLKK